MDVTDRDIAKIPAENLHLSRAEFAALWREAERLAREQARTATGDWWTAGVVVTCRWLANATVRPEQGSWRLARSPVTGRTNFALPELIQEECLAAEKLDMRHPRPHWLVQRPGWSESIVATFAWAWWRRGPAPLPRPQSGTNPVDRASAS